MKKATRFVRHLLFVGFLVCANSLFAQIVVQAENFTSKVGDAVIENGISIGYFGSKGESLTYSISVPQAGFYEIAFSFASGLSGTIAVQNAQGAVGLIDFSTTGAWANWTATTTSPLIYLNAGTQNFSILGNGTDININSFTLTQSTITDTEITSIAISPNAISIMPNAQVQLTAVAKTETGKAVAAAIVWSSNAPAGLFTAGATVGIATVTTTVGSITASVIIRIATPSKMRNYVVSQFGLLTIKESYAGANDWAVRGTNGAKASLTGPSFFWSGSAGTWWTKETVDWLVDDWHIQVIRCPVSIAPGYWENSAPFGSYSPVKIGTTWNNNDYFNNPELAKKMMDEMIAAAIENDIYVIIDFHEHHAQFWKQKAIEFFDYFSKKWGAYPNVLYEIFNEPFVNDQVNQDSYADAICQTIRANDPDNIIIIGSKNYSRDPEYGASFYRHGNIAGTWHGYVENNHQADWSGKTNWNNGTAIVVTEWGRDATSDGGLVNIFKNAGVIHCPWSINNKQVNGDEKWSALNASCTKVANWTDADLSTNGKWMRTMMLSYGYNPPAKIDPSLVTLTIDADKIIKLPTNSVTLSATATSGYGTISYAWTQTDGATIATISAATTANATINNLIVGKYSFKVTASNGIASQEKEISVIVLPQNYTIPVGGEIIDNVEDNNTTTLWGGTWNVFDDSADKGASTITTATNLPNNKTISATYTLDKGDWTYNPYCGIKVSMKNDESATDLTSCSKITYKYKGSAHDFRAEMASITDNDFHKKTIPASTVWTTITVEWASLAQDPTWGVDVGSIAKSNIDFFSWQVSAASGSGTLEIDDLTCVGATGPASNMPPVAYAGNDISISTNSATLDGSKSFDIEGDAFSYSWTQVSGPNTATIALSQTSIATAQNLIAGTYIFRLETNDGAKSADSVSVTVTQNIANCTVNLTAGWNLLSISVQPTIATVASIFPHATIVKTNSAYYKTGQAAYLNSLKNITAGEGYLVYNSIDESITISGTVLSVQNTTLLTGWNLIGVPNQTNYQVSKLPNQTTIIKDFDSFYQPATSQGTLQELQPGKAYFIKVSDTSTLIW